MNVFREGRNIDGESGRGHILSLELDGRDLEPLLDTENGQTGIRFASTKQSKLLGWDSLDKAHVRLENKYVSSRYDAAASLRLDLGGDLYFSIYNNRALREAVGCEVFQDLNTFVTSDPSEHLRGVGIEVVRIYYLNALARELPPLPEICEV